MYCKGAFHFIMADAAAELDEGGIKRAVKDLFAGAAGGVAQVLIGQSVIIEFIEFTRYLPIALVVCASSHHFHMQPSVWYPSRENMEEKLTSCNVQDSHSVSFSLLTKVLKESILSHVVQILSKSAFKQALDTPAP